MPGHSIDTVSTTLAMTRLFAEKPAEAGDAGEASGVRARPALSVEAVYDEHFAFVWRSLSRLGVPESSIDDAAQDVFVVVHRRLAGFEGRSSIKTWLFGIAMRVAKDHRRALARRKPTEPLRDSMVDGPGASPMEEAAKKQAAELLRAVLRDMDDDKRAVFIMSELEQMSVPEIAEVVGANVNTVYSRLRAARTLFEDAVKRHRAREEWRAR